MFKSWQPQFTHKDLEILSEQFVYEGYAAVKHYSLRFRLFKGGWSQIITRDVVYRAAPNAAAVLLYDPKQDKVVMIEQIRLGALQDNTSPWLLEIVAGVIDPGKTPEATARQEAKEEANCAVLSLKPICVYYASPGMSAELTHVFCGMINIGDTYSEKSEYEESDNDHHLIHGLSEDGEDIRCHILKTDQALALLAQGKITSASAVIALQWLALNRASLNELP